MAGEDAIWLIWGLGFGTGAMIIIPLLYFMLQNWRKRNHVWGIVRGKDGRFRVKDGKVPDEKGAIHFKTWSALIDPTHVSTWKAHWYESARPAWLYEENDPSPINLKVSVVEEKDEKGKRSFYRVTNPERETIPGYVFGRAIDSHITREALGTANYAILIAVAAIAAFVGGAVFMRLAG